MPFLEAITLVLICLTITVVALSIFAVVTRALANHREGRIERQRAQFLLAVRPYLAGDRDLAATARAAPRDKDVALGALLTAAQDIAQDQFPVLHELADRLGLARREIGNLRHRDWTRRAHAATRLGQLRYPPATEALVAALEDPMLDVRLAAAHALAQLRATDAIEPILKSLALPMAWPLQRCVEILYEMGTTATPALLALQPGTRLAPPARIVVARVLGMLRARAAVPELLKSLNSDDPELRVSSAQALGVIGEREAAAALRAALDDPEWMVRSAAAVALGALQDRGAVPALAGHLADGSWWVRFNAAQSLYRLNAATQLQDAAARHADPFARDISRQILEEHGAAPVPMGAAS